LSHQLSCLVKSIVHSSYFFLYHLNLTMTLFCKTNSINTNLISFSFHHFTYYLLILFFTVLELLLKCSTFFPQSSTRTASQSHQQVLYLLCLLNTSSSSCLLIYLWAYCWHWPPRPLSTYLFTRVVEVSSAFITTLLKLDLAKNLINNILCNAIKI
jgi:hypothetical protein